MEREKEKVEEFVEVSSKPSGKGLGKKKYKVVISCTKFTIYVDEDGNNVKIMGDYGVKTGEYLEI